jgi:hypothetical protein
LQIVARHNEVGRERRDAKAFRADVEEERVAVGNAGVSAEKKFAALGEIAVEFFLERRVDSNGVGDDEHAVF